MWKSLLVLVCAAALQGQPESWVDPDTGHRVVRLTREPNRAFAVEVEKHG